MVLCVNVIYPESIMSPKKSSSKYELSTSNQYVYIVLYKLTRAVAQSQIGNLS